MWLSHHSTCLHSVVGPFTSLQIFCGKEFVLFWGLAVEYVSFVATALVWGTAGCTQAGIWKSHGLTAHSFIWNWFLCLGWSRSQESCFSMWLFSWPSIIYYKGHHFLGEYSATRSPDVVSLGLLSCYSARWIFSPVTTTLWSKASVFWSLVPSAEISKCGYWHRKTTYTSTEEQILLLTVLWCSNNVWQRQIIK